MSRPTVVVTRRLPPTVEATLSERYNARLNLSDEPLGPEGLVRALREADAVLCTVTDRLTPEILAAEGVRAKLLANYGVGFNHIDIAAARQARIIVTNTPDVLTDATADLAMTLLLSVARRAGEGERELRAGRWTGWRPMHHIGTSVTGKTLGIIGFGRIGRAVAQRAHDGFGMRVLWYNASVTAEASSDLPYERAASIDALLMQSDFVSLHCPSTPATRHLMNTARFAQMKPTAFLVNTARGDVVDEAALVAALDAGTIAGAGLDVYEREPTVHPGLLASERCVLLPHLGSATLESRVAMGERALANLDAFFRGDVPRDRVG